MALAVERSEPISSSEGRSWAMVMGEDSGRALSEATTARRETALHDSNEGQNAQVKAGEARKITTHEYLQVVPLSWSRSTPTILSVKSAEDGRREPTVLPAI